MNVCTIDVLRAELRDDLRKWDDLVDRSPVPDVYYRPGYVLACRETDTQSICALGIDASGYRMLVPLIISEIPGRVRFAYSPYGYGGLLPLDGSVQPAPEQIAALRATLQKWARENNIACVVLRMHPLLNQSIWFDADRSEDIVFLKGNNTVAVGLKDWDESGQRIASLNKGRRSDLKVARRNLQLRWICGWSEESREALEVFHALYDEHMRALNAAEFYFFPTAYYSDLARGLDTRLAIGLATLGSEVVGGALFMADRNFAHYHLSACNLNGYEHKASTLLVNEGASWARQRGCSQLHLGGGLKSDDTLFRFKQSFGGQTCEYATVTVVADRSAFDAQCQLPNARWPFSMHRHSTPSVTPA